MEALKKAQLNCVEYSLSANDDFILIDGARAIIKRPDSLRLLGDSGLNITITCRAEDFPADLMEKSNAGAMVELRLYSEDSEGKKGCQTDAVPIEWVKSELFNGGKCISMAYKSFGSLQVIQP